MATQPQKDNVIRILNETIEKNLDAVEDNKITIVENQNVINDFNPSCGGLDGRIVVLTNQINVLKSQIISIHSQAYAVGCGTTAGQKIYYPDSSIDSSYNLSDNSYEDEEPYEITNVSLSSSNVGFGTFIIYRKDDNQSSSLGIYYNQINTCFGIGCNSGNCVNFSNEITQRESQIEVLRSELTRLVVSVNSLKTDRVDYQIRRWADKHTNKILLEENERILQSIKVLNDPEYDQFI